MCGSEIVGREAAEVLEEYREMVVKAKEAEEVVGLVDEIADDLWRAAKRVQSQEEDDDSWVLASLREQIRESSQGLAAATRRYPEALRKPRT
jgi:broad-specificity NMP kinase